MAFLKDFLETLSVGAQASKHLGDVRHGLNSLRGVAREGAEERRGIADAANSKELKEAEARYNAMLKKVEALQSKPVLSTDEKRSLEEANTQLDEMSSEVERIRNNVDHMNQGFDETAGGIGRSSKEMKSFGGETDEATRKVGVLTSLLRKAKENAVSLAAGYTLASVFSTLNENTNNVIEGYYNVGKSMSRVSHGFYRLSRDTWNFSRAQSKIELAANAMNMPLEAGAHVIDNLSQKVNLFYRTNGQRRTNIAFQATKEILAFSRITGASVDQSSDLYARFINQFGKTHGEAINGLHTMARAGQLVNEQLEDMGSNGHIFLSDLTGILNDAAGAFDGFTLNVEHLSAVTANAVKIGHKLGMTYNQSMDLAKQSSALFAKPGGFVAFQAGEKLKQEVIAATQGMTDAEDRADALARHFGTSLSTARTLDMASKGVNSQMNVMEILKGTEKGIDAQWDLMRQQAKNNSLDPEIFKQFIGGENLSPEQAGDMLQMLKDSSSKDDFKRALNRTKGEASSDAVIQNSVLGPKMIKDWIAQSDISTKMYIAQGLTIASAAKAGAVQGAKMAKYFLLIAGAIVLFKQFGKIKQWIYENAGVEIIKTQEAVSRFGESIKNRLEGLPAWLRGQVQSGRVLWNRVLRPGQLIDKLRTWLGQSKDYLSEIPRKLHDIWNLFKTGAARVQTTVARGAAAAGEAYRDITERIRPGELRRGAQDPEYRAARSSRQDQAAAIRAEMANRIAANPQQAAAIRAETAEKLREMRTESNARLQAIRQESVARQRAAAASGGAAGIGPDEEYAGGGVGVPDVSVPGSSAPGSSPRVKSAMRARREAMVAQARAMKEAGLDPKKRMHRMRFTAGRATQGLGEAAGLMEHGHMAGGFAGKAVIGAGILAVGSVVAPTITSMMSDDLDKKDEDENTAGGRKYNKKIEESEKDLNDSAETLEMARDTHDQALIAAIESEVRAKEEAKKKLENEKGEANRVEAAYNKKVKMMKTLKDHIERLKDKKNRTAQDDKIIEGLEKTLEGYKKSAGEDKGKLHKAGMSPTSENAKWEQFNIWTERILGGAQMMFSTVGFALTHWRQILPVVSKTLSAITWPLRKIFGKTSIGSVFTTLGSKFKVLFRAGNALGFLGRIFTKLTNPLAALEAPVTKLEKVVDWGSKFISKITGEVGAVSVMIEASLGGILKPLKWAFQGFKWIARKMGIITTVLETINGFTNTEGGIGRKIVGGLATGAGAGATIAAGTAAAGVVAGAGVTSVIGAPAGMVAGAAIEMGAGAAAPVVGRKTREGALGIYDRFFGDDAGIKAIDPKDDKMRPSALPGEVVVPPASVVNATQQTQTAGSSGFGPYGGYGSPVAQMGPVDSNGASMMTLTFKAQGAQDFLQSGINRIRQDGSGISGPTR